MAATPLQFGAFIDEWTRKSERRMEAVFKESTARVKRKAQERIPVDTGFARASIVASLSEFPPIDQSSRGTPGQKYSEPGDVEAVIASAKLGDIIRIGWTASYVGFLENGHSKQAPSGFVGVSALEWPAITQDVIAEAKTRSSS